MAAPTTASAAEATTYNYSGSAYGTKINVGSSVTSGQSAALTFGCTADGDLHQTNSTAGINLAPLASTGTVSTTGDTSSSPVQSKTSATTQSVNLLGGLVQAAAVKAVSATTKTSDGFSVSAAGTTLTDLTVAGRSVRADAAPNTRVNIGDWAYVVVNEQAATANSLKVFGLHVVVKSSSNNLGIAAGTNIVVSQASSSLSNPVLALVGGYAYGSRVNVGSLAVSNASFAINMPCLGTNGVRKYNTGAGLNLPEIKTGAVSNSVLGTATQSSALSKTNSTVASTDLLSGLIAAETIKVDARVARSGSTYTTTTGTGTTFGTLSVRGLADIDANVAPNTRVSISGVGTLYLNRVIRTDKSVQLIAIQLVLTKPVNGLDVGTDIRVGEAKASVS